MAEQSHNIESLLALYGRVQEQLQAERNTTLAVIEARKSGASWLDVSRRLGISRQQAWNRYHELDCETDGSVPPGPDDDAPTA